MENMNLATRCREAIAQVASLKKELALVQKKQQQSGQMVGEELKKREGTLRRSMGSGSGSGTTEVAAGKEEKESMSSRSSSSSTTDLDRIMSSQKFGGSQTTPSSSTDVANSNRTEDPSRKNDTCDETTTTTATQVASNATTTKTTSNTKIPITIAPTHHSSNQKDDEFDADIDMVDFFTKQSNIPSSGSSSTTTTTLESRNTKSLHPHVRKVKSNTDDVMPEDMTGAGLGFSPERKKGGSGDSLLSSLDGEFFVDVS